MELCHVFGLKVNDLDEIIKKTTPPAKAGIPLLPKEGKVRAGIFFPVLNNFTAKVTISRNFSS
jgi:hypothetical protein